MPRSGEVPRPDSGVRYARGSTRVLFLAAALLLSGCGLRGSGQDAPSPASEDPSASQAAEEESRAAARPEVLLEQGQALLIAGRHGEAIPALDAYLIVGETPEHRLAAAWSLALAHLHPDNPQRDPARAGTFLQRIRDEHPGTVEAVQAALLDGMLRELTRTRATVEEQRRAIAELNQTVEQLKQIDLARRSGGGGDEGPRSPR